MRAIIYFVLIFLLGNFAIYSQTIAKQSFEASGDTWVPLTFSTPPCTVGNDIWDYVTSLPSVSPSDGNQFWGIRNLDGTCGGSGFETITLPNVDISSFIDVTFSFDYYASSFENDDSLKYELFYDNLSQGEVVVVDSSTGNTNNWVTETITIPNSVTNVSLILSARNDHNNDRGGFDNVKLAESFANDNCLDAISLTVGNSNTENIVMSSNIGATDSGELPEPSCANYGGGDVWFMAQVPTSGLLSIETLNAGGITDTGLEVYTGTCGNLTQIDCDDNGGSGQFSLINLTSLSDTQVYIRVWGKNNNDFGNFNIVAYSPLCPFSTTWDGTIWDNQAPNSFTTAIINNDYDTAGDGSFESCDCQINSGSTVNVRANDYITVYNDLTVNGALEVRHQGSLQMTNDDGEVSVSGTFNAHKTSTILNNYRDFTYWSSPVNTTIEQAFGGIVDPINPVDPVDPNRIFEFNINNNTWDVASDNMIQAKGYIAEAPSTTANGGTHSVKFTGTPNNGIVDIAAIGNDKFNLIGNPYPSAINIDNFIQSNNIMDGTIWLWTHYTAISNGTSGDFLGDDYATYNLTGGTATASSSGSNPGGPAPTNNIGSGQGFFVKATSSGTLSFQNDMRLQDQNTQFFRASDGKNPITKEKDRIWLNVESNTGGAFNQVLIGFFDQATDGVDRGYDGSKVSASWISFYSKIEDTKYTIQGLSSFNVDKKVAIGFDTYIDQLMTYKMSIDNIEGILNDTDVYIVDNELDITHDLKQADYEFEIDGSGNFPDRFTLQFSGSVLDVDDLELDNNFIVTNEENTLQLKANSLITNLKIYDIRGRLLINKKPNDLEFNIKTHAIKKGMILVVNASFENNQSITKKVILH